MKKSCHLMTKKMGKSMSKLADRTIDGWVAPSMWWLFGPMILVICAILYLVFVTYEVSPFTRITSPIDCEETEEKKCDTMIPALFKVPLIIGLAILIGFCAGAMFYKIPVCVSNPKFCAFSIFTSRTFD